MDVFAVRSGFAHHILDALEIGVVITDRHTRILYANEAAEGLLCQTAGALARCNGRLTASAASKRTVLRELIVKTTANASGRFHLLLSSESATSPDVALCVTPFRDSVFLDDPDEPATAMIFARRIERDCRLEFEAKRWFGLTDMEAKVASALASGQSLAEAAATFKVSLSTVRTHLSNVFLKTGTRQQSQVAALLRSAQIPLRPWVFAEVGKPVLSAGFNDDPAVGLPGA